jgi:hypothetical protein
MNTRRRSLAFIIPLALFLLFPNYTLGCACCSNDGEYYKGLNKIEDYQLELMKQMRFGNRAFLFLTEAGYEVDASGIADPKQNYSLVESLASNAWRLTFRDGTRTGVLNLPLPEKLETYKVDIHDGKRSGGGGPLLYKEWRFEGSATGLGFLKTTATSLRYFLVLQGRGNGCDNAEDFTDWRLDIRGENTRYAFTGKMGKVR